MILSKYHFSFHAIQRFLQIITHILIDHVQNNVKIVRQKQTVKWSSATVLNYFAHSNTFKWDTQDIASKKSNQI